MRPNAWGVDVGQVWDDETITLLVVGDLGGEWYKCLVLRALVGYQPGAVIKATAFVIQHNAKRID